MSTVTTPHELEQAMQGGRSVVVPLGKLDLSAGLKNQSQTYYDSSGNIVFKSGTSVPADATAGYAVGCIFQDNNATDPASMAFANYGTASSCAFRPIGSMGQYTSVGSTPFTLTGASGSGWVFETSVADVVFNLPDVTTIPKGTRFTFVNGSLSSGTGLSVSPAATDNIRGKGITTVADDKDFINSGATDALGDACTLVSDGATGWVAVSVVGTWARET